MEFNRFLVKKSFLNGKLSVPASKSHTLRAILLASLAEGTSIIRNYLDAADSQAMIIACRSLGAEIHCYADRLEIKGLAGKIDKADDVIHAGNSGIVLRLVSAIGALSKHPIVITGDESIRTQRPMSALLSGLRQLGASAISTKGNDLAPVIIQGPLKGGTAEINGQDSQPVSALLIAASLAKYPTEIKVIQAGEKPWIDLTLNWLTRLKLPFERKGYEQFIIPGNASIQGFDYTVPGDFSSAAFPITSALITGSEITIDNLDLNDCQGDKVFLNVIEKMGAHLEVNQNQVLIKKSQSLKGIEIDIDDLIDALPILAVLGCYAVGETRIVNAAGARHKESDRLHSMASELKKMGADVEEFKDSLLLRQSSLKGAELSTYNDHRVAMALTVAAMGAEGTTTLASTACIHKTYPSFQADLRSLGAQIETV